MESVDDGRGPFVVLAITCAVVVVLIAFWWPLVSWLGWS